MRIGREEEGALAFGGGSYCLVEGAAGALGEEEVSLGEVQEDLFEEFGCVEGGGHGAEGWGEGESFGVVDTRWCLA